MVQEASLINHIVDSLTTPLVVGRGCLCFNTGMQVPERKLSPGELTEQARIIRKQPPKRKKPNAGQS